MPNKAYQEFVQMSDEELLEQVQKAKKAYDEMRYEHSVTGIESPIALRKLRRDIARMLTELRKRELDRMSEDELAKRSKIRARRRRQKKQKRKK